MNANFGTSQFALGFHSFRAFPFCPICLCRREMTPLFYSCLEFCGFSIIAPRALRYFSVGSFNWVSRSSYVCSCMPDILTLARRYRFSMATEPCVDSEQHLHIQVAVKQML